MRRDSGVSWPFRVALATVCLPVVLLGARGCESCDPDAHIAITNRYSFPVRVHHLDNSARNMPDQVLNTLPPGERTLVENNPPLDGDIDNIQIEDLQGHKLLRLSTEDRNVVCKSRSPEYVWEITVGP